MWGLAAIGIAYKLLLGMRFQHVSNAFYVGMGALAVVAVGPISHQIPSAGQVWLAIGGLLYGAGLVFFLHDRRYGHTVWHVFVLGGSACHFVAVLRYATPAIG